jgi:hypothetical protein
MTPSNFARVTSNTPFLSWEFRAVSYPSPESDPSHTVPCQPEKYRVSISTAPYYTDELGSEVAGSSAAGGWTTPTLQYGKTYRWNVTAVSKGADGPTSLTWTFSIGNPCGLADLKAPVLLEPPNGAIVDTLTPTFRWDTTMTCVPQGYLWRFSRDPSLYYGGTNMGPSLDGYLPWIGTILSNCTTYYWRVAAYIDDPDVGLLPWDGLPNVGPSSETWMFRVMLPGTGILTCSTPPTAEPTTAPLQPVGEATWEVTMNANCRVCPSTFCNESGFAPKGYAAKVEGRNEDGTWFRLIDPKGVSCWIWGRALTVPQGWENLKILAYPTPPPTAKPRAPAFDCSTLTNANTCLAHPGCVYDRAQQVCKNP